MISVVGRSAIFRPWAVGCIRLLVPWPFPADITSLKTSSGGGNPSALRFSRRCQRDSKVCEKEHPSKIGKLRKRAGGKAEGSSNLQVSPPLHQAGVTSEQVSPSNIPMKHSFVLIKAPFLIPFSRFLKLPTMEKNTRFSEVLEFRLYK